MGSEDLGDHCYGLKSRYATAGGLSFATGCEMPGREEAEGAVGAAHCYWQKLKLVSLGNPSIALGTFL